MRTHKIKLCTDPFNHIVVNNFLKQSFYIDLVSEFNNILQRGLSLGHDYEKFSLYKNYDGYYWVFPPEASYPLNVFFSYRWAEFFSDIFDIPVTNDISVLFNHHKRGSLSGSIHSDFIEVPFVCSPSTFGSNVWYYGTNNFIIEEDEYGDDVMRRMRSIIGIFYLNNTTWKFGDGGETGLYSARNNRKLVKAVAPVSNTLLVYEITPNSYHRFLKNHIHERNSLLLWFHSKTADKILKFPQSIPEKVTRAIDQRVKNEKY